MLILMTDNIIYIIIKRNKAFSCVIYDDFVSFPTIHHKHGLFSHMKDKQVNCGISGLCGRVIVSKYCIVIGSKHVCKISAQSDDGKWSKSRSQDFTQNDR